MFNLMTFNIRFDNPADKKNSWNSRKEILVEVVNNFCTDILATQEGRRPQLMDLNDLISLKLVQNHRNWIEDRMYPCIFFNKETIDVEDSGDIWLSETPNVVGSSSFGSMFPRLCTWIKGVIKKSKLGFFMVNAHLDHVHEETRIEQMKVLIKECKAANDSNLPFIICGDFNQSPFSEIRTLLIKGISNLYDPWIEFKKQEETTFHKFKGKLNKEEEGARIDWILLDKAIKTQSIDIDKYCKNGKYPSDHFAIKGRFSTL